MKLSDQLTIAARQLEGLVGAHWNALPPDLGMALQSLRDQLDAWAQREPADDAALVTEGYTASRKLTHIERELAHAALHVSTLLPRDVAFDLRNYARQIGDLAAQVAAMEERLRPPSRRELGHDGNVVSMLLAWRQRHTGTGDAA